MCRVKREDIILQVLFNSEHSPDCSMFSWNGDESVDCTEGSYPGQNAYDLDEMIFQLRSQTTVSMRKNENEIDPGGYK